MNRFALVSAAFVAPVIGLTPASTLADFTGLTCEPFVRAEWFANGYTDLTTFRLYTHTHTHTRARCW